MSPSVTYTKPADDVVQPILKVMKTRFDDREATRQYLLGLLRAATFPNNAATEAWSGDILDQLAEWEIRHGDPVKAHDLLQKAHERFDPLEALGPARSYRRHAQLLLLLGRFEDAFNAFDQAERFHAVDRKNGKGRRQRRVTAIAKLEARVVADDGRHEALEELVEHALFEMNDFCLRDQHDRVQFVLPYTDGAAKRSLHARQLEIDVARRRPVRTMQSIATVVIGEQKHLARSILSKGVARLPRPL